MKETIIIGLGFAGIFVMYGVVYLWLRVQGWYFDKYKRCLFDRKYNREMDELKLRQEILDREIELLLDN